MKKLYFLCSFLAAGWLLGCSGISDEDEQRISNLEARVTAIENVLKALNDNVAALQAIASGKTINSVKETAEGYVLILSNGEELTLKHGSVGMGKAPLLSVDKNGCWLVDYQDGKGAVPVLADGKPVQAVGQNGVTPQFGVSAEGNWTVSYDGGQTWTGVLDSDGKPVSAVGSASGADSYFADVTYNDEALILTLKNGQQYTAPVVGGFLFKINVDASDQTFKYGEKKVFGIEQKGISRAVIICPDGWHAWLEDLFLTVQAPVAPTKAALADSRKDVAVLAFSEAGHATVAKVSVVLDGQGGDANDPVAGITLASATASSLTFNVVLVNATAYKYILRASSDPAPAAADILSTGKEGPLNVVTVDGLSGETDYILYVVPLNAGLAGPVCMGNSRTQSYATYYEAWNAGKDITIAGKTYNKATYGEGTLVTSQDVFVPEVGGVYFVAESASALLTWNNYRGSILVIGNTPGVRSPVIVKHMGIWNPGVDEVAFKNVAITSEETQQACCWMKNDGLQRLAFDGCALTLNTFFVNLRKGADSIGELALIDNDIRIPDFTNTQNAVAVVGVQSPDPVSLAHVTVRNNLVWSENGQKEFNFIRLKEGQGATVGDLDVERNTLYNVDCGSNVFLFRRGLVWVRNITGSVVVKRNLTYTSTPRDKQDPAERHSTLLVTAGATKEETMDKVKAAGSAADNWTNYPQCAFMGSSNGSEFDYSLIKGFHLGNDGKTLVSFENPFTIVDLAVGKFVRGEAYASYGAER